MRASDGVDDRKSKTAAVRSTSIVAATESLERTLEEGWLEPVPFVEHMHFY